MPIAPEPSISATVPDWSREAKPAFTWDPSRSLIASLRAYERWRHGRGPVARGMKKLAVLRHRWWSIVTAADIPLGTKIGGGLLLPHPTGVVIHPDSVIGPNCLILQQVTLAGGEDGAPVLEGHVDLGAGAKVLGRIHLGAHSRVGANAVVTHDVVAGDTVVGIPARSLRRPPTMVV